ncbi:hypothetical protein [Nesterenkonia sp. AN1]|uniref:hypothetical protein n=1 Tax=Nesterenkonia sp. AN1 TaxID=652017 RepID=UPI001378D994|nr:hypothetical protein [Nesterenkonia sp. AN1]
MPVLLVCSGRYLEGLTMTTIKRNKIINANGHEEGPLLIGSTASDDELEHTPEAQRLDSQVSA